MWLHCFTMTHQGVEHKVFLAGAGVGPRQLRKEGAALLGRQGEAGSGAYQDPSLVSGENGVQEPGGGEGSPLAVAACGRGLRLVKEGNQLSFGKAGLKKPRLEKWLCRSPPVGRKTRHFAKGGGGKKGLEGLAWVGGQRRGRGSPQGRSKEGAQLSSPSRCRAEASDALVGQCHRSPPLPTSGVPPLPGSQAVRKPTSGSQRPNRHPEAPWPISAKLCRRWTTVG